MRRFALVMVALVAVLATIMSTRAQQNPNVIYQRDYGSWRVACTKDAMSDMVECLVGSVAPGNRSILGGDNIKVWFWSTNRNAKPALTIEMPYLIMPQRGVTIRSDSNQPRTFNCTTIQKQQCTIQGTDRDWLLNDWRSASKVVARGYTFSETGPDYTLDMGGFNEAFSDFTGVVARYL